MPSSLVNKIGSSILSTFSADESSDNAELRRISGIARKETIEDISEFKNYLEDLKAIGGSPTPMIDHMKITEENEEYSESSINNSEG
jgi:hypothetical protein